MKKKKISKKEWAEFTAKNADSSYGLVVNLAILILWEAGVKTEEEASKELMAEELGLSGAQAGMAISMALQRDAEEWLDETSKKIRREIKMEIAYP